jgi:hypothetical protein
VIQAAERQRWYVTGLPSAKLTAPLKPHTPFRIQLSTGTAGLDFPFPTDQGRIAHGTLLCAPAAVSSWTG